jgi:hypothetical protein
MGDDRVLNPGIGVYPVQGHPEYIFSALMIAVVREFIPDIQQDHKDTGKPDCKSRYIDKRKQTVTINIAKSNE